MAPPAAPPPAAAPEDLLSPRTQIVGFLQALDRAATAITPRLLLTPRGGGAPAAAAAGGGGAAGSAAAAAGPRPTAKGYAGRYGDRGADKFAAALDLGKGGVMARVAQGKALSPWDRPAIGDEAEKEPPQQPRRLSRGGASVGRQSSVRGAGDDDSRQGSQRSGRHKHHHHHGRLSRSSSQQGEAHHHSRRHSRHHGSRDSSREPGADHYRGGAADADSSVVSHPPRASVANGAAGGQLFPAEAGDGEFDWLEDEQQGEQGTSSRAGNAAAAAADLRAFQALAAFRLGIPRADAAADAAADASVVSRGAVVIAAAFKRARSGSGAWALGDKGAGRPAAAGARGGRVMGAAKARQLRKQPVAVSCEELTRCGGCCGSYAHALLFALRGATLCSCLSS